MATQLKQAEERYSAKIAEARAAISGKDGVTAEAREKYDTAMKEAEALAGDVRRFKQLDEAETEQRKQAQVEEEARKAGRPDLPQPGDSGSEERGEDAAEQLKQKRAYRKAMDKFIRSNNTQELRALGSSVGSQGGYPRPDSGQTPQRQRLV